MLNMIEWRGSFMSGNSVNQLSLQCIFKHHIERQSYTIAVLKQAVSCSVHPHCLSHLWWVCPIHRMNDSHMPKDITNCELATRHLLTRHSALCFKYVFKRDLKLTDINPGSWEQQADDCSGWHHTVQEVENDEKKQTQQLEIRKQHRK